MTSDKHRTGIRKKVLFSLTATALLFVFLECAFRLMGYGHDVMVEDVPDLGWRLLPDQDRLTGNGLPIHVNAHGLRDEEFQKQKPAGETRILVLGDSVTFGIDVDQDQAFPRKMHGILSDRYTAGKYRVMNGGVHGYDMHQYLLFLERYGAELDPDIVLVAFFQNDVIVNPDPVPFVDFPGRDLLKRSAFFDGLRRMVLGLSGPDTNTDARDEEALQLLVDQYIGSEAFTPDTSDWVRRMKLGREILARIHERCEELGIEMVVALLPAYANTDDPDVNKLSEKMAEELEARSILYVDLLDDLSPYHPDIWLPHDEGHLSDMGHEKVAEKLVRWLEESGVLPRN